jgi:Tfp pilus assembly protein PilV
MKRTQAGFSMPEVLVASFILIWVILSSLQLTSSSILGMGQSKRRGLVDAAIASRIEKLRSDAFSFLCTQGCTDNELTKALEFNLITLKPLCSSNTLGQGLLNALPTEDKPSSFTVNTVQPILVQATYTSDGNKLHVSYSATDMALTVNTTLVPHAQGWCP